MHLTIKNKLSIGFLTLCLIVLVAGVIGILMVRDVNRNAEEVIDHKIPVKDAAGRLLNDIEHSLSLSRQQQLQLAYSEENAKALEHTLNDIDVAIALLIHGSDSPAFKEYAGDRVHASHTRSAVPAAQGRALELAQQVREEFDNLSGASRELLETHRRLTQFNFSFDGVVYDLKTFLLGIDVELGRWLEDLEDAAKYNAQFKGAASVDESAFGRWYKTYPVQDERLGKLLKNVHRDLDKTYQVAAKVNGTQDHHQHGRLLKTAIKYTRVTRRNLIKVQDYVIPIVDELVARERAASDRLEATEAQMASLLNELTDLENAEVAQAKQGAADASDLATRLLSVTGAVGVLISLALGFLVTRSICSGLASINQAVVALNESGEGDLTKRLALRSHDELAELADNFNRFIVRIQQLVDEVKKNTVSVAGANTQLAATSEELSATFVEQAVQADKIRHAMDQMSVESQQVMGLVGQASQHAQEAGQSTHAGMAELDRSSDSIARIRERMGTLSGAVNNLGEAASNINAITETIVAIAEQTNLLALNAAIEAARAGEQGRGFAVVADEVRTLSARTRKATVEIETIVNTLTTEVERTEADMATTSHSVEQGVEVIRQAHAQFGRIVASVDEIARASGEISATMEAQNAHIQEVDYNIREMASGIEQTSEAMTQVAKTTAEVSDQAENLNGIASSFRT